MNLTEDYCSQEVFQLLREKEFPVGVGSWSRGFVWDGEGYAPGLVKHENSITHQMAMKWLREVNGLHISIGYYEDWDEDADGNKLGSWYSWDFEIYYLPSGIQVDVMADHQFDTYEEAVEAALKYALKNLI